MKLEKNRPNIRFMVDFWGPEAAGGHSRPKRGKHFFDIAARVGAHVCYSLPSPGPRPVWAPVGPGPGASRRTRGGQLAELGVELGGASSYPARRTELTV